MRCKFFLLGLIVLVSVMSFSSAAFNDCYSYEPQFGGNKTSCNAAGCLWASNVSSDVENNITDLYDPYCMNENCCFPNSCWQYDGTNESTCLANDGTLNCTWDPFMQIYSPNGSLEFSGGCMDDFDSEDWGGMGDGCWQNDGDKSACTTGANAAKCSWSENNANQNPWCGIKTLADAQWKNSLAIAEDVGCCEQKGCWSYDGNQTACEAAFQGNCFYDTFGGWCNTKWCSEVTTEENCTYLQQNLYMPCGWNLTGTNNCEEFGGGTSGGFDFYSDDADSCFDAGGWYNATGDCIMPAGGDIGDGSGGFMFGGEAHCWFADNKESVCGNITGCAYCVAGSGSNGIENSSNANICFGKPAGLCEGHDTNDRNDYTNANNSENLKCSHIQLKAACNYGPLPNCKWTNSSTNTGAYCEAGASTEKKSLPPVQYCEDPLSKNNYTLCMQLANNYMMPCIWDNSSSIVKNCTFNGNAVFGGEGEKDFEIINSEFSCTSAGGSWFTEFYVDFGILKQDSWCEMTGMFDIGQGQGVNNKMNCDTNCWACEFQSDGSKWGTAGDAQSACEGSALGYCNWVTDSNAFNGQGFCDYPDEMEDGGAKDCNFECEGCNFMNNPKTACESTAANGGCQWVNDTNNAVNGGFCVAKGKKVCSNDCFSCFDNDACQASSLACTWDEGLCRPQGFEGEICFDGIDNDNDNMIDCGDPDCGFDNFCGGGVFGGDCFAQSTEATCNQTVAFEGYNCSWINDTWNPDGWCDMPGMNCWKFDNDLTACGAEPGCTNSTDMFGGSSFVCDMNKTKMENANCWQYDGNQSGCNADSECQWAEDPWCRDNPNDQWCIDNANNTGWCDFKPFATCMGLNESSCNANSTCVWNEDEFSMQGGWCDVACFTPTHNETTCNSVSGGLCEWRDMSQMCHPEVFQIFGKKDGGKSGCWQYDGNQTACLENSITCQYKNDTYANNNVTPSEPSGWCMDKAEYEHFGDDDKDVIDLAFDSGNILGSQESGVSAEVDLLGMGMRVVDEGFNFGAGVYNISEAIMCNGFGIVNPENPFALKTQGSGNKTTKFYWYLDTNDNSSDGCEAVPTSGSNLTGYDFMISYISRNTTDGVVETKQLMRCLNGDWSPTNALVTTSKKLSCGEIGGVMVAVSKQDLESFSSYKKTANMKIFMTSANRTDTRVSPSDSVGPGYYTPGTIDFGFVDCSDPENSKDAKCKNFQKFGFNVFEECKNGIDDDENGLIDCNDPFCKFIPDCASGSAFSFVKDENDVTAPVVMFSDVERLSDSAFVRIDTNEPSNLTLEFYKNDSSCTTINTTLYDVVSSGYQANSNFKPFHSIDLMLDTLGYSLVNNTVYYYKIKTCDSSGNCAYSACSNFTTKKKAVDKSFIFKMDLPSGFTVDIPALNKTGYNFTETFGNNTYDVGVKTNTSVTKNMNMTIHCGDMAIGFFGMNVLNPINIDLSNGFICDEDDNLMGMNSSLKKWNKLIDEMHLGGASDYIEITIPVAYSTSNTFNWTDDTGSSGQDVDDYVECVDGGSSNTKCKVPVSMGFSAYTISVPASESSGSSGSSGGSGGSSSGGGGVAIVENETNEANNIINDSGVPAVSESSSQDEAVLNEGVPESSTEDKSFITGKIIDTFDSLDQIPTYIYWSLAGLVLGGVAFFVIRFYLKKVKKK